MDEKDVQRTNYGLDGMQSETNTQNQEENNIEDLGSDRPNNGELIDPEAGPLDMEMGNRDEIENHTFQQI